MKKYIKTLIAGLSILGLFSGCTSKQNSSYSSDSDNHGSISSSDSTGSESSSSSSEKEHEGPLKILFLGNSLIFFNDMPQIFANLANGQGKEVYVDSVTQGSCTMSLLATTETDIGYQADYKLTTEQWDYVIIEPSRRATPFEDTVVQGELDAAEILDEKIQAAGAETLIYSVWGLNKGETGVYKQTGYTTESIGTHKISREAHCKFMAEFGEMVSDRLGGRTIIRAGYAFENCIAAHPLSEINIYHTDEQHPSPSGSYLIACTIYDTIFNERSENANYTYNLNTATALQEVADATVIDGVVPVLHDDPDEPPATDVDQRILIIGAPAPQANILYYKPGDQYASLMANLDTTVAYDTISDSSYTMRMLSLETSTKGKLFRNMLAEYEYDAIFIQISRRATIHSTDVNASELAALKSMKELLHSETDNIFIYAPRGETTQHSFINEGDNYTDSGSKDGATGLELCDFYSNFAKELATAVNGKPLDYVGAYQEYKNDFGASKEGVEYLHACCFYNVMYEQEIPDSVKWQNNLSDAEALSVRKAAAKHCLPTV